MHHQAGSGDDDLGFHIRDTISLKSSRIDDNALEFSNPPPGSEVVHLPGGGPPPVSTSEA